MNYVTEDDELEWSLDQFMADCDAIVASPPAAPAGLELVECEAQPRHWPTYVAYVDGQYPAPCMYCVSADQTETINRAKCEKSHRRWKSWRVLGWLAMKTTLLGITNGHGVSFGRCEFCGIGRQYMHVTFAGRRRYLFGVRRETWQCLRRGHRYQATPWGLCSVCAPCPDCESTDPRHSYCSTPSLPPSL